ncbi:hypothetical protein ALI22I_19930 [Saccharothrix sp. ALI-22-I]|uniref:hypothetical protein n=1 Tax=Saccharothrix sp. ALI-22-I TaxID=1933778 RepID=UPI00097C0D72|nr:hypothetical protein [Saccharothrix sp. ALI-22-I]ONI88017.1 hypothetical protein ALI22I_19930 [Saccharothrix sp. ALI-22-I]
MTGIPELELTRLLTCAALEPGLDGVLLLDLPARPLLAAAEMLADILGEDTRIAVLGTHEQEDDLWFSFRTWTEQGTLTFTPVRGPLLHDGRLVVVVPDLARLSLAATRAAVVTLGSPVALLERHGISVRTANYAYWLASCAAGDIGQVSPHLLDRFTARFPAGRAVTTVEPVDRVWAFANGDPEPVFRVPRPPESWLRALEPGAVVPEVSDAAAVRAIALHDARFGVRRPLALLRLARAFARLDGAAEVTVGHVDAAAALTRLTSSAKPTVAPSNPPEAPAAEPEDRGGAVAPVTPADTAVEETQGPAVVPTPILAGPPPESMDVVHVPVAHDPFPEDAVEPEREATPLVLPWQRRRGTTSDRGEVIGTEPTNRLADIAWVASLREAAKYQAVRGQGSEGLRVCAGDLRRYRRSPKTEHLLVLVLDHTCHQDWDWSPALAEHLRLAYTRRATVCLVEVGAASAELELRAERVMARSLLDPRVAAALERPQGTATPLAHGLELARAALRHALQHGRTPVSDATLVVVTDGLGNVPLEASLRGTVEEPVRAEGIDDAIAGGKAIAELDRVLPVVVLPPRVPYPDVPLDLARAFGPRCLVVAATGDGPWSN